MKPVACVGPGPHHDLGSQSDTDNHRGLCGSPECQAWFANQPPSAPTAEQANRQTLHDRAAAALDANRTFLALTSPTAAQNAAQIKALTRQTNALIRLTLGLLDGTD